MKGYQIDNVLYVFPQTADTIPFVDSDVTIIYVQQEDLAAWKTKNSDNADMIFPYNYNVMTVQPKSWSGHEDDNIYVPVSPELAWSTESATAQIGGTNTFPTLTNPHSVTVSYTSSDIEKATINASTGEITLVAEGNTTISAAFVGDDTYQAQTVTYTLTVQAAAPTTFNINVIGDGTGVDSITSDGEGIEYGTTVTVVCKTDYEVRNVETVNTHESVSYTLTDTLTWQFTMPEDDIYLEVQPVQTPDPNEQ